GAAGVDAGHLHDLVGHIFNGRDMVQGGHRFSDYDGKVLAAFFLALFEAFGNFNLNPLIPLLGGFAREDIFRKPDVGSAGGNANFQRNPAGSCAHDLDDRAAMVGGDGVADLVDGLHRDVHRGVEADGILGAGNIVVDGAGKADAGDAGPAKVAGAAEGAVAADDDQAVDPELTAVVGSLLDAG